MSTNSNRDAAKNLSIEDARLALMRSVLMGYMPEGEPVRTWVMLFIDATSAEIGDWLRQYAPSTLPKPKTPGFGLLFDKFKPGPMPSDITREVFFHRICLTRPARQPDMAREGVREIMPMGIKIELQQRPDATTQATVVWDMGIRDLGLTYLARLLMDMEKRFPAKGEYWSISKTIFRQMVPERETEANPPTGPGAERPEDKEAVAATVEAPQKQVGLTLPKGTRLLSWKKIYDEIAKRPDWKWTYAELSQWLFKMHSSLSSRKGKPLSRDTLSNIVEAGKNGLLDNIKITEK